MKILVVNGPNLNTLGKREPDIYGNHTLEDINSLLKKEAKNISGSLKLEFFQSNSEGEIVSTIQDAFEKFTIPTKYWPTGYDTANRCSIRFRMRLLNL